MNSPFTFIDSQILESLVWDEHMPTADWARQHIYLGQDVTPLVGMMSFEKTPWIEQILNDWDKPWVEQFNIMASTQVGKTTIEFTCMAKELSTDPCMMQLTIPTDEGVSDFIKTKLDPFLSGIKTLQDKMLNHKEEEKQRNTKSIKEVPNGMLFVLGNTEKNRKSKTVKIIFIDEAQLFGKGHIKELIGRTKFHEKTGRKIFIVSSRSFVGDEIEITYDNSYCKKDLMIECPECNIEFYPTSKHFKFMSQQDYIKKHKVERIEEFNIYKKEAKETAIVECNCGKNITSRDIEDLIREKKVNLKVIAGEESDTIYGYRLNALATGLTKYSTIAEGLIEAGTDEEELLTMYRDYFNEIFVSTQKQLSDSDFTLLDNGLKEWEIPEDTIGLYMGIDTQKDHFWVTIVAYTFGVNSHLVYEGREEDFGDITDILDKDYFYADGTSYKKGVKRAIIDSQGYVEKQIRFSDETGQQEDVFLADRTAEVREWVYERNRVYGTDAYENEKVYASVGKQKLPDDALYSFGSTAVKIREGYKDERKIKILKLNSTELKIQFLQKVKRSIERFTAEEDDDAALYETRLHYINSDTTERIRNTKLNTRYDRQITAEEFIYAKDGKGKPSKYKSFERIRRDNHYLDCMYEVEANVQWDKLAAMKKPVKKAKKFSVLKSLKG